LVAVLVASAAARPAALPAALALLVAVLVTAALGAAFLPAFFFVPLPAAAVDAVVAFFLVPPKMLSQAPAYLALLPTRVIVISEPSSAVVYAKFKRKCTIGEATPTVHIL